MFFFHGSCDEPGPGFTTVKLTKCFSHKAEPANNERRITGKKTKQGGRDSTSRRNSVPETEPIPKQELSKPETTGRQPLTGKHPQNPPALGQRRKWHRPHAKLSHVGESRSGLARWPLPIPTATKPRPSRPQTRVAASRIVFGRGTARVRFEQGRCRLTSILGLCPAVW